MILLCLIQLVKKKKQMIKRKWRSKFGIQGNFYPMTNLAFIEDDKTRLSLASGQCHAVTGARRGFIACYKHTCMFVKFLKPNLTGQIEVMLDRRLLQDDWRGLNENVTDNVPIASTFAITFENFGSQRPLEVGLQCIIKC